MHDQVGVRPGDVNDKSLRPRVESTVQYFLNRVLQRLRKLTLNFYRHVSPPWQGIVLEKECSNKEGREEQEEPKLEIRRPFLQPQQSCVLSPAPCNL